MTLIIYPSGFVAHGKVSSTAFDASAFSSQRFVEGFLATSARYTWHNQPYANNLECLPKMKHNPRSAEAKVLKRDY
jgi:hypothetical protein